VLPHVGLAKWLEADELADLLDACTDKSRWLVAVMALAGLRVSEAAALRWRSVDLASGRLTVETSKTETGRRVIADLNPELVELLKVHRHAEACSRIRTISCSQPPRAARRPDRGSPDRCSDQRSTVRTRLV
jgi:integrase